MILVTGLNACGAGAGTTDAVNTQDAAESGTPELRLTPAPAVPPELRDRTHDEIDRIRSEQLVDEAVQPAEAASRRGVPGFPQLVIAGHMAGEIWWKDPPPEIAAMEGTTKSGVTVTVVRVAFSETEMVTPMNLASSSASSSSSDLPQSVEARPNVAFDGIELGFLPEIYEQMDKRAVARRYAEIVGMPVTLYETQGATDT